MNFTKQISKEQAYQKIKHFCAYQERTHKQVKEKLYSFGLRKTNVESLLSQLIEENILNEERFANAFVRGKFKMNKWGRVKIKYQLQQKQVSVYNIKNALQQIDDAEYFSLLQKLAFAQWQKLKNEQHIIRNAKTQQYLLQKGFEPMLISTAIKNIRAK